MKLEEQLAQKFKCTKCGSHGAQAKTISTTGSGISKMLDIQHNKFVAVSCNRCGYTEFFNPAMLGDQSKVGTILDVIFER